MILGGDTAPSSPSPQQAVDHGHTPGRPLLHIFLVGAAASTSVGRSRRHLHTAFAGPGSGMSPDQAAVTVLLSRRGRLSREAEEVAQGMALGAGESDRLAANSCRLRGPSGPPPGMSLVANDVELP